MNEYALQTLFLSFLTSLAPLSSTVLTAKIWKLHKPTSQSDSSIRNHAPNAIRCALDLYYRVIHTGGVGEIVLIYFKKVTEQTHMYTGQLMFRLWGQQYKYMKQYMINNTSNGA